MGSTPYADGVAKVWKQRFDEAGIRTDAIKVAPSDRVIVTLDEPEAYRLIGLAKGA